MAYKENLTRVLEIYGIKVSAECDIDWNGRIDNSDVYLESVNGIPAHWIKNSDRQNIEREILSHEANLKNDLEETKSEMLGDEMRGN
jgi:hypothetical protein